MLETGSGLPEAQRGAVIHAGDDAMQDTGREGVPGTDTIDDVDQFDTGGILD